MKLVILGDQGVLSAVRAEGIQNAGQWQLAAGAAEAVARLNHVGFHAVMTADPLWPAGPYADFLVMQRAHAHMHAKLSAAGALVDAVFFSAEAPADGSAALARLLQQVSDRYQTRLADVFAVYGNRHDTGIAAQAGCTTCLLDADLPEQPGPAQRAWRIYRDLGACADWLVAKSLQAA